MPRQGPRSPGSRWWCRPARSAASSFQVLPKFSKAAVTAIHLPNMCHIVGRAWAWQVLPTPGPHVRRAQHAEHPRKALGILGAKMGWPVACSHIPANIISRVVTLGLGSSLGVVGRQSPLQARTSIGSGSHCG